MKNALFCVFFCSGRTGMLRMASWVINKLILRVMRSFWAPREHFWANNSISVKFWNFRVQPKNAQKWPIFGDFSEKNRISQIDLLYTCECELCVQWMFSLHLKLHFEPLSAIIGCFERFLQFFENSYFFNFWHFLGICLRNP